MKRNFILVIVGIVALVVIVRDVPFIAHVARVERERQITRLERDAYVLAGQARELVDVNGNLGASEAVSLVDEFSANSAIDVVVTDKNGILIASSVSANRVGEDFKNRPEIASALLGNFALGGRQSVTVSDTLVYAAIPIFFRDSVAGVVRLSRPQTVIDREVNSQVRQLVLAAGVAVLIAIIAGVALAGVVSAPLRRLQDAAEDLAQGRNAVVKPDGPKELRALARQFNSMSDRVSQMLSQQKRFAGDAAHQLRTPLTALRLRLEQAHQNLRVDTAAAGSNLEAALKETDRLSMLTERMLQLARSEGQVLVTENFDVGILCREIVEEWSALAGESQVSVVAETNGGLRVDASRFALHEIVANYLDNALNHAPPRSTVSI
ncbi:MAG: HAMP domain-containing protein, partial [Actinobacteria bacterium]|nr:HAMP domain-containing protein [Actinomycetota bacterium]